MSKQRILFLDDEAQLPHHEWEKALVRPLARFGLEVDLEVDPAALPERLAQGYAAVLLDLKFGREPRLGFRLLGEAKRLRPDCPVVMLTGSSGVAVDLQCHAAGADGYHSKEDLDAELLAELLLLLIHQVPGCQLLLGGSAHARALRQAIRLARSCDSTVLITGETGTGKELVARGVHLLIEFVQPEGLAKVRKYVEGARQVFKQGKDGFRRWVIENAEPFKSAFRFNLKDWVADVRRERETDLVIEEDVAAEARYLFSQDLFCEADVVRAGLDNILDNAVRHGYKDRPGPHPLTLTVRLVPDGAEGARSLQLELADRGRGFVQVAQNFRKPSGSAGCGLSVIRSMCRWFDLEVRSTCQEVYRVKEDREEKLQPAAGTGVAFTLTYRIPRTRESKPCPVE